jgi:transcriptional regulator with XRE-family HTH domain
VAKPELRAAARQLRRDGLTYDEIVARLGVSKSSVSLWVRDIPFTDNPVRRRRVQAHVRAMAEARWSEYRVARDARRDRLRDEAADSVLAIEAASSWRSDAAVNCTG